ncbi:MAG: ATPase, T2SS/T4P/T4SS family [Roseibium sp.]|uniref:GspE/PulE family protein n=1 Tax=Roseibium sp. TaxID=1936156 RepID=UPI003297C1AE
MSENKKNMSDADILSLIQSASLLTAKNGEVTIADDDRRLIAIFDNGVAITAANGRWNSKVKAIINQSNQAGYPVTAYYEMDVQKILNIYNERKHDSGPRSPEEESVLLERQKQLSEMIARAAADKASDIHIRVLREYTEIRTRVFGRVKDETTMTMDDGQAIIKAAFAVASDLGNSTSDLSFQQGALTAKSKLLPRGVEMIRLQYSPTSDGRGALVARLKYTSRADEIEIDTLGYDQSHIDDITDMRTRTNGLYILAGKVSSGKSTTLQRVLNKMFIDKQREISTYTIEEPVELELPGAIQVAAKKSPDGTDGFYEGIKAALRSDPNVIVLGEIRSGELAKLAIEAVMTGHALWSTIHAGSALGILDRLSDLGVENWKIQDPSVVRGLVYQRLTGVICKGCRINLRQWIASKQGSKELAIRMCKLFHVNPEDLYVRGGGCPKCKLGLSGRTVVAETIQTDPHLLDLFSRGKRKEMREHWIRQSNEKGPEDEQGNWAYGMGGLPVLHHALVKVGAGLCDIGEVQEEVDFLSTYERDFMHLQPRLIEDVKKLKEDELKKEKR